MITEYSNHPDKYTYSFFRVELFKPLPPGGAEIIDVVRESGVPHPYIYFPQTLGMLLGRALMVNPEWLYLLGRIFNLIFFAVCVWLSIRIAPIGKGVFALVALYPMAMQLGASLNSDVYSIALALLALAQYLRIAYSENPARMRDLLILLLTMALLGPPKVVFIPLMMLAFFLPDRCFSARNIAVFFRILVAAVCVITTFIAIYVYLHRGDGGVPIVTYLGQETFTFEMLLADPVLFAKMCYRTIIMYFEYYLTSMIGAELGWIDISINKGVIAVFLALSAVGAFKMADTDKGLLLRDRILFPAIFLIAAFGTAVVMFVSWTPLGSWNIMGLQGRYFLPVWPLFLFFAARWPKPVRPKWLNNKTLLFIACVLQVFVLISAYLAISGRETLVL